MITYNSTTGELRIDDVFEGYGYSGFGDGRNQPRLEAVRGVGPIPRGRYSLELVDRSPHLKAPVYHCTPIDHDAHGRTGLLIHGDNIDHTASHGCIILGRTLRVRIGTEHLLDVI